MKKYLTLMLIFLALGMCACHDDDEAPDDSLAAQMEGTWDADIDFNGTLSLKGDMVFRKEGPATLMAYLHSETTKTCNARFIVNVDNNDFFSILFFGTSWMPFCLEDGHIISDYGPDYTLINWQNSTKISNDTAIVPAWPWTDSTDVRVYSSDSFILPDSLSTNDLTLSREQWTAQGSLPEDGVLDLPAGTSHVILAWFYPVTIIEGIVRPNGVSIIDKSHPGAVLNLNVPDGSLPGQAGIQATPSWQPGWFVFETRDLPRVVVKQKTYNLEIPSPEKD